MIIKVALTFNERDAVSLLNWLARCNARLLRERPRLPLLYRTSVRYGREEEETWSDFIQLLAQGWEDCDALAAARAGELLARGWRALSPSDPGYAAAKAAMDEVAKLSAIGGGGASPSLVDGKTVEAGVAGASAVAKEVSKAGKPKKEAPAEGAAEPKAEKKPKAAKPAPTEGGKDGELFGVKVEGKPEKK